MPCGNFFNFLHYVMIHIQDMVKFHMCCCLTLEATCYYIWSVYLQSKDCDGSARNRTISRSSKKVNVALLYNKIRMR